MKALRHIVKAGAEDEEFHRCLVSFVNEQRRWGYRRVFIHALPEVFAVGREVFQRTWRQLELRV